MIPPPDETVTRVRLVTVWPSERMFRRLDQYAAWLGVRVAHRHDGALWLRQHLLTVTGPAKDVRHFHRVASIVLAGKRGREQRETSAERAAALRRLLNGDPPVKAATTSGEGGNGGR
ncbi:hypothetical protein ACGFJC_47660 [Nonomuraea fuscirosea]|uniref:hypothetical protein n=1 Tax=Nonomuraea fuscirosea TaxID=1291556 RepID=UPI00372041A0